MPRPYLDGRSLSSSAKTYVRHEVWQGMSSLPRTERCSGAGVLALSAARRGAAGMPLPYLDGRKSSSLIRGLFSVGWPLAQM